MGNGQAKAEFVIQDILHRRDGSLRVVTAVISTATYEALTRLPGLAAMTAYSTATLRGRGAVWVELPAAGVHLVHWVTEDIEPGHPVFEHAQAAYDALCQVMIAELAAVPADARCRLAAAPAGA
jgi:hypothetical protein